MPSRTTFQQTNPRRIFHAQGVTAPICSCITSPSAEVEPICSCFQPTTNVTEYQKQCIPACQASCIQSCVDLKQLLAGCQVACDSTCSKVCVESMKNQQADEKNDTESQSNTTTASDTRQDELQNSQASLEYNLRLLQRQLYPEQFADALQHSNSQENTYPTLPLDASRSLLQTAAIQRINDVCIKICFGECEKLFEQEICQNLCNSRW
uniref:Uncharacterized protein n=1 Tax=Syphacia muris TaxID=451379 RepID=A0A0N5AYB0_9BILA